MNIAKVYSAIPYGYSGRLVTIEGDSNQGLPCFNIVGMASKSIDESRDRIRSAIHNSLFSFPRRKVVINLAPAELRKDGTHLDLPIALAILELSQQLLAKDLQNRMFVGELSLNGDLRPVKGILNIIETAKKHRIKQLFIPTANMPQAALLANGINLTPVQNLRELWLILKNKANPQITPISVKNTQTDKHKGITLDQIFGQNNAKRALTIAIAGHHNILLTGPPGTGKTLLAKASANLLPPPSITEQIAITKLHSLNSICTETITTRPYRAPHHRSSLTSLIGGGPNLAPGEISLAHLGILHLDELPEFPRDRLEALRQPLEDRKISISHTGKHVSYPANFMLIATMNPCPCGYYGSPKRKCTCTPAALYNYRRKLSGPLLDRIDIVIELPLENTPSPIHQMLSSHHQQNTAQKLIQIAQKQQLERYHNPTKFNAHLSSYETIKLCHLTNAAKLLLDNASEHYKLSARAYFKTIKLARTIADLEAAPEITELHLSEALQYRQRSNSLFF